MRRIARWRGSKPCAESTRLVTQNVDGLHQRAGSANVIELHGTVGRVICLDCGADHAREAIQQTLEAENAGFLDACATAAPDGDADVLDEGDAAFNVPHCAHCGGMLKPDVVFFGENVPRDRVGAAMRALEQADAMLVVGSSLMVWSGYRFCERAGTLGKPIAAINLGRTRADHLFALKVGAAVRDGARRGGRAAGSVMRAPGQAARWRNRYESIASAPASKPSTMRCGVGVGTRGAPRDEERQEMLFGRMRARGVGRLLAIGEQRFGVVRRASARATHPANASA